LGKGCMGHRSGLLIPGEQHLPLPLREGGGLLILLIKAVNLANC
jgi:hypothetical protein